MLNYFIFLLNAVFFGTFYATKMKHSGACNPNLVQAAFTIAISGFKNDAIFNVYLPLLVDIFQVSNTVVIQIAFVCTHCFIVNRSGITRMTYFIFHLEHIIVLSFFFIGANHLQQIMLYFLNFIIVQSICAIRHKKLI
jgi:hypothetical protein